MIDTLGDERFHGGESILPARDRKHSIVDETRKNGVDVLNVDRLIGDLVHRKPKEKVRAHWCESHDHEVPLTHRFAALMSRVKSDDPGAVERIGSLVSRLESPMRSAEVQYQ